MLQQVKDNDERMYMNIHKMELERIKYMLKQYLRSRLFKIETQMIYIIENDHASLLSEGEMTFVWSLYQSKKAYFNENFFDKIPSKLNNLEQDDVDKRLGKIIY